MIKTKIHVISGDVSQSSMRLGELIEKLSIYYGVDRVLIKKYVARLVASKDTGDNVKIIHSRILGILPFKDEVSRKEDEEYEGTYEKYVYEDMLCHVLAKKPKPRTHAKVGTCAICQDPIGKTITTPMRMFIIEEKKSIRSAIPVMQCNRCKVKYCHACISDDSKYNKTLPVCSTIGCSMAIDAFAMKDYFIKSKISSLNQFIKDALLDIELSMVPNTELRVATEGYSPLGRTTVNIVGITIYGEVKRIKRALIVKCCQDGCSGFLDDRWICTTCCKRRCGRCREPIPVDAVIARKEVEDEEADPKRHYCDPDTLASIAAMKAIGCTCPGCGDVTEKSAGCRHMFCLECKTSFNYVEGGVGIKIPDSQNTNPAYHAWKRKLREQKMQELASKGIETVDIPDEPEGVCEEECPTEGHIPSQDRLIQCMCMCLCSYEEIRRAVVLRHTIAPGSKMDEYITRVIPNINAKDCELLREYLILARMGAKIDLNNISSYPQAVALVPNDIVDRANRVYVEDKCIEKIRTRAFSNYRERQRAFHHRGMIETFRAGMRDILNNVVSYYDELHDIHGQLANGKSTDIATAKELIYSIRAKIVEQIVSSKTLITFSNKTFNETDELLGYSTSPQLVGDNDVSFVYRSKSFSSKVVEHTLDDNFINTTLTKYTQSFLTFTEMCQRGHFKTRVSGKGVYVNAADKKIKNLGETLMFEKFMKDVIDANFSKNSLTVANLQVCEHRTFASLTILNLSENPIGPKPITQGIFSGMPLLQTIVMKKCGLMYIDVDAFSNNVCLAKLELEHNSIQNVYFLKRTRAVIVNVNNNQVSVLNFGELPSTLQWLSISHNGLSELRGVANDATPNLRHLDVSNNSLKCISRNNVTDNITTFNAGHNAITRVDRDSFSGIKGDSEVRLNNNFIPSIVLDRRTSQGKVNIYANYNSCMAGSAFTGYVCLDMFGMTGYTLRL